MGQLNFDAFGQHRLHHRANPSEIVFQSPLFQLM